MSGSQQVLDHENKYRYGVLIGNQQEERFGLDLVNRENPKQNTISQFSDSYKQREGIFNIQGDDLTPKQKELLFYKRYNQNVTSTLHRGELQHITFGHGIQENDFQKRDFKTMNELNYNNKVKPQDAIFSKFYPGKKLQIVQTTKIETFQRNKEFYKNYQENLPEIGDQDQNKKNYRAYDEFTKKFDLNWTNIGLRGK